MKRSWKRLVCAMLALLLISAAGCGKGSDEAEQNRNNTYAPEEAGIFVRADGTVTGANVEKFDTDKYSESGLKEFVQKNIETYNGQSGTIAVEDTTYEVGGEDAVKLNSLTVENDTATLLLDYKSCGDYLAFNAKDPEAAKDGGEIFWVKTVKEAAESGTDFSGLRTAEGQEVTADEVKKNEGYYVAALDFATSMQLNGQIVYISDGVEAVDSTHVTTEGGKLQYVVFQ